MNLNEIKKLIYKQQPKAELIQIRKGFMYYDVHIITEFEPVIKTHTVFFRIPFDDMGDATFTSIMDAKFLIRWIVEVDNVEL